MQNRKVARRNDDANLKGLADICFGQTLGKISVQLINEEIRPGRDGWWGTGGMHRNVAASFEKPVTVISNAVSAIYASGARDGRSCESRPSAAVSLAALPDTPSHLPELPERAP